MSRLPRWSSDLVPIAAIAGACFLLPVGGVAFTVVGGIASGLATPLSKSGSDWCVRRLIRGQDLLNHDLQTALVRAFDQSMRHLEKLWNTSYRRDAHHNPVVGKSSSSVIKALFKEMRQDAETILTDTRLKPVVGSAEALQLLGRQDFGTQVTFNAYLDPYLDGHSQQFVTFLKQNYAPELACRFGEELKADTKAWRAFQRLVNDSLLDATREMRDKQDATQGTLEMILVGLEEWKARLTTLAQHERDPTGEVGLASAIAEARDQVIAAMAEQFGLMRQENRALHEQTHTAIGELRIDIEELGLALQSRPNTGSYRVFEVPHLPNPHLVGRDDLAPFLRSLGGRPATSTASIQLRAYNGQWVCAEGGGGGIVVANRSAPDIWETFTLTSTDGDPLQDGSKVALQAANGQWVCAEGGGGGTVVANRSEKREWETFTITIRTQ